MKTICITGHRPAKLPWKYSTTSDEYIRYYEKLKKLIKDYIDNGYTHFISGMALGVDLDFAEIVLHFRDDERKGITLECALPCPNQTLKWKQEQIVRYNSIIERSDTTTIVNTRYFYTCMLLRNEYMVNNSDEVIAVWNEKKEGGTWYTIKYAQKCNKTVKVINILDYCKR